MFCLPCHTLSRSNSVERKMRLLLELIHLRNVCMSIQHSHWHLITRKQPEMHMLPERVGNSDLSQNQLLVDMVKKTFFNKNNFFQKLNTF